MDRISNMLSMMMNAGMVRKDQISFPHSSLLESVLEVLKKEGFITSFEVSKGLKKNITVTLAYQGISPKIKGAERLSKLSRRMYRGVKEIVPVKRGYGIMVLSTPKGILTDAQAKKENVGGEALFIIW